MPPAPLPAAAKQDVTLPPPLANDIVYVAGSTQKVCQLTGEPSLRLAYVPSADAVG